MTYQCYCYLLEYLDNIEQYIIELQNKIDNSIPINEAEK